MLDYLGWPCTIQILMLKQQANFILTQKGIEEAIQTNIGLPVSSSVEWIKL
jgi:hypothetical protein